METNVSQVAGDRTQSDDSVFSLFCFGPNDSVTAVRAYRVKISIGGPKGYKGVVLDISPDLPIQQKLMRVYECDGDSLGSVEAKVLKEIRGRHPDLVVHRHPAKADSGTARDERARPQRPEVSSIAPVAACHTPPKQVSPKSAASPSRPISLAEARRIATSIANDASNERSVQESVRNLAQVLATVLTLIAEATEE
jgi:hypothetical protein